MSDVNTIKSDIFEAVELVSGYDNDKIIFANRSAPRPDDSYISILITPVTHAGYSRSSYVNAIQDLDETISNHTLFNISINFFKVNKIPTTIGYSPCKPYVR